MKTCAFHRYTRNSSILEFKQRDNADPLVYLLKWKSFPGANEQKQDKTRWQDVAAGGATERWLQKTNDFFGTDWKVDCGGISPGTNRLHWLCGREHFQHG